MYIYKSHKNRNLYILIVFTVALITGIGFAFLTSNLSITGSTKIKDNIWDVHFGNITVKQGSIDAATPTITNGTNINYSVTLNQPGDFYEFSVPIENSGTIDGMIDSISATELTTEQKKYMEYTYYFASDQCNPNTFTKRKILKNNGAGLNTLIINIKYKDDITASDLPTEAKTLNLSFQLNVIQADETAFDPYCE
ncbi:MAG: hypothetical protein IJF92_06315 [Bacilli bacterium]|nr:hypothetical protein [Bacilli bacterium]